MNQEYKFKTTGEMLINIKPSYTFTMHNADGEVGRLDFNGPKLIFTGDAEESAKAFLDWLALSWGKRLQEEREAEREACAKVCDELRDEDGFEPYGTECAAAIRARGET
jgi:hypothetical protein